MKQNKATAKPPEKSSSATSATKTGRRDGPVVGSVESAVRILNYLGQSPHPMRLRDIARDLSLNPSSCLNILRTLARDDVVHADPATKTYGLGMALVGLAGTALGRDLRVIAARRRLEEIATRHHVSAMLWRRSGEAEMLLLALATGGAGWRVQVEVGSRAPLLQGSMGRVMANHVLWERGELKRSFAQLRWDIPFDFAEYQKQIAIAKERGWSVDDRHYNRSMVGICVPIIESDSSCQSVLTVAMLANSHTAADQTAIIDDLRDAAAALAMESFGPR